MSPRNPPIPPSVTRRVDILAYPSVQLLDVAGPLQVLSAANDCAAERGLPLAYDVYLVGQSSKIRTTAGLEFAATPLPSARSEVDTLLIAGGRGVMQAIEDLSLVDCVKQRAIISRRATSVCAGAFSLGAAGLLNGRRAVPHSRTPWVGFSKR